MLPDRWKTIEETYHAALRLPLEDRARYLDAVCANDPALRREIESLLDEARHTQDFMEQPAGGLSVTSLAGSPESLEGQSLNHYQIGSLVGSGGEADVYRARDTRLQRDVAIKILRDVRFLDREQRDQTLREARALASLNHPNIASIYGIEEGNGMCALVLEFVEGESLSERISRSPFSIRECLEIAKQLTSGLRAAHGKGIIHRDFKPSNVKIAADGTVKIVDFGLAKLLRPMDSEEAAPPDFSRPGLLVGTLPYMSPEQARGKAVDARTDIWAFGCVLYEMLAGLQAFQGDTPTDLIIRIATEEPDWSRLPRASDEISLLIRKCMEKNTDSRYQSVGAIAADLEVIQSRLGSSPTPRVAPAGDDDFVLRFRFARALFLMTQAGYMAIYTAAMYYIDSIAKILAMDFGISERSGVIGTMILAMCGIAARIYLTSAVGWRHPAAGRKFELLFPGLLVFDSIWAASPLLLWHDISYGLAMTCVALLAYVPFAQRTLIRSIYPRRAFRTYTTR